MDGWAPAGPHRVVQAELPFVACQSASQSEAASSGHVEGARKKGGRPRKSWQRHSSFDMLEREGLREAARRWLQEQKVLHKFSVSSSKDRSWQCWLPVTAAKTGPSSIALRFTVLLCA